MSMQLDDEPADDQDEKPAYKRGRKPSILDEDGDEHTARRAAAGTDNDLVRRQLRPTEAVMQMVENIDSLALRAEHMQLTK